MEVGILPTSIQDIGMSEDVEKIKILKRMLTTTKVAHLLGIHPNTLRNWADQGLIHTARLGPRRDRRFTRKEVTRFIKENSE